MKYLTIFILISIISLSSYSQTKQNAKDRKIFIEAYKELQIKNISSALILFKSLYEIDTNNTNVSYLVGYCYYNSENENDIKESIKYFTKATKNISQEYKREYIKKQMHHQKPIII